MHCLYFLDRKVGGDMGRKVERIIVASSLCEAANPSWWC